MIATNKDNYNIDNDNKDDKYDRLSIYRGLI